jgi:NAD(P)-dependent dehydrogenase (short-subunit alcohol dehydrogenase family)
MSTSPGLVIVYGGSGGVGAAIARRLRAQGRRLHLVARDEARLRAVADEVSATFTVGDVADAGTFARVQADVSDAAVGGLVYAVGTIHLRTLPRLADDDIVRDFTVNALGAARAVRAHLPGLQKASHGASVVLFSTVAVAQGFPSHVSVSMAKGAVEGLTRALSAELAPQVRVNAIAPSLLDTPLASSLTKSEAMAKGIAALHPLPRLGTADDVAGLAALLLGPDGSWTTGQVFHVDGGRSRARPKG